MGLTERLNKILHIIGGVSLGLVILAGTLCAGYLGGTRWFEKKDFVGQKYEVYKVYNDKASVICQWDQEKNGWLCKKLPSEFAEAVKSIFNFDEIKVIEGSTVNKEVNKSSMINKTIKEASSVAGVSPILVKALVWKESNFNPGAISKKGCKGLMQLCSVKTSDPLNPISNIYAGVFHLKSLLIKYKGNERLALAAYNAGTGAVDYYHGVPPYSETQNYVEDVIRIRNNLQGKI